jgi:hypothetical protein
LTLADPRANSEQMNAAKREEILNLIRRGTFKLVTLPEKHNEDIVPSRLVLAIKHSATGETKCKARFTVGRHKDKLTHSMVHTASTLSQTLFECCLLLHRFLEWTFGAKMSNERTFIVRLRLRRKIFVKPQIMQLGKDEFFQLLLPLYGLTEAGE